MSVMLAPPEMPRSKIFWIGLLYFCEDFPVGPLMIWHKRCQRDDTFSVWRTDLFNEEVRDIERCFNSAGPVSLSIRFGLYGSLFVKREWGSQMRVRSVGSRNDYPFPGLSLRDILHACFICTGGKFSDRADPIGVR
jgi:hypothetical protein